MGKRIVINDRTRKIRAGLLLLLILIGIGYAAIRSGLNINGTTHVMSNTWDVHFENYQASSGSVTPTTEPSTTGNPTTVTYEVTLTNPGDYYEFTIDAVNNGTMDVMIESFSSKIGNTEITPSTLPPYLSYSATYSDGTALANKQELLHNTRETLKLKIAYRDDIPTTDLPSTVQDLSLSFTITYVQADDTAEEVVHGLTGTRYTTNLWTSGGGNDQDVWIGQKPTDNITLYETAAEARAAFNNSKMWLKHNIEMDIVKESYVCFERNNNTYCLQGGVEEEDKDTGNHPIYDKNRQVLLSAFESNQCNEDYDDYGQYDNGEPVPGTEIGWLIRCDDGSESAHAHATGLVGFRSGVARQRCNISNYGDSYCSAW